MFIARFKEKEKWKTISALDVENGKVRSYNKKFYALTYELQEVTFVKRGINGREPHFRFLNGDNGNNNHGGTGESLTHYRFKNIIASADLLVLNIQEGEFPNGERLITLRGVQSVTEFPITVDDNSYFVDICVNFEKSEPADFAERCHNRVLIEVTHKHPTNEDKYADLKKAGYAVFEFDVPSNYELEGKSENVVNKLCQKIENFAKRSLNVICHFCPKTVMEYIELTEKFMKQSEKDTSTIKELTHKTSELESECNELKNERIYLIGEIGRNQNIIADLQKANNQLYNENKNLKNECDTKDNKGYGPIEELRYKIKIKALEEEITRLNERGLFKRLKRLFKHD